MIILLKTSKRERIDSLAKRRATRASAKLDDASWETEGSGLGTPDADKLINQLHVSPGSIRAGNTSKNLRKQVVDLVQLFVKHGMINEFKEKKFP